jgi:hypothetical protein
MKTRQLLKEVHKKNSQNDYMMGNHSIHGTIPMVFAEPIQNPDVSIKKVISKITRSVSSHLFYGIDGIYVGHIPEFDRRKINAIYSDGAIYTTSFQDNEMDMVDDIVHELSHSTEKQFGDIIYGDGKIEKEFLLKRKKLFDRLKEDKFPVDLKSFLKVDFDLDFDFFLLKKIGYPTLKKYIDGLFNSCYSITSLNEYYAVNFTDYFLYDRKSVRDICPEVYLKIIELIDLEEEDKDEY